MNKITSKLNANDNKQLVLAKNLKTVTNHSDKQQQQQDEKSQTDSILEYVRQRMIDPCKIVPGQPINYDAEKLGAYLNPVYPGSCTELINSTEWLSKYGLRINRLTFENILKTIGFKQNIEYINQFRRNISSKYSKGLFLQTQSNSGPVYNITVSEERLLEIVKRLEEAIKIYRLRLQWLTSESRRLFGLITEANVCVVLDCRQRDRLRFEQFKKCALRLLNQQVAKLSNFNIIRCHSGNIEIFKEQATLVSPQSIEEATEWLYGWQFNEIDLSSNTSTCEGVMMAFKDKAIESIYLISEGLSSNGAREILFDKLIKESNAKKVKLSVVSFNCYDLETVEYLRRLATSSYGPGNFHAYCLLGKYDDYQSGPIDPDPTKNRVVVNKLEFGGTPPGAGVKSDLLLIFNEIQEAQEALDSLNGLIEEMRQVNKNKQGPIKPKVKKEDEKKFEQKDDEYMTSKEWLLRNGLNARKLDLFDILMQVCFRHCDGVVDIKREPGSGKLYYVGDGVRYYQGDSIPQNKLINAKYCDQFAHVLWHDGTLMHVHVTPDLHRSYEQKVNILLSQYEKRIDWLSKGSRELFGTVIENNICILIDTSQSMQIGLDFVKRKLAVLMQEQLKSKQRFNLIAFNSKINPWRDRMVEVDDFNMKSALEWINSLHAQSTTNTMGAIRFALSDLNTEAIYLLTDGRPDQEPRQILSQVNLNTKIPIHTISFNCNDSDANKFLSQLASETNGRYHYFNESGWNADPEGPVPYQSEDINLLKKEIEKGKMFLNQMVSLREECARLSLQSAEAMTNRSVKSARGINSSRINTTEKAFTSESCYFESHNELKSSSNSARHANTTSVLKTLNEIQALDWILPETRELLERQYRLQLKQQLKMKPKKQIKREDELSSENDESMARKKKKTKLKPIENDNPLLSGYSRVRSWLQKNSLIALKLTLFDALKEAIQDQGRQQVAEQKSLLDELFESKVWQDILDLASVSNVEHNQFKQINLLAIPFDDYAFKLEEQIKIYQKYLSDLIWKSLPDSEKRILNLKDQLKFEFNETNRSNILKSLDHSNWALCLSKKDFESIENQIEQAKTHLRRLIGLKNFLNNQSTEEKPIASSNQEENQEEDQKDSARSIEVTTKQLTDKLMQSETSKEHKFSRGDRVIARNDLLGYYFSAKIIKSHDTRHANIRFDHGPKQTKVSFRNMIKLNGKTHYLCLGDYVMALVINEFDQSCWVPGIVQTINEFSFPKLYTILYFNGQEGDNSRTELIKINKSLYGFIVNYIRTRLGVKPNVKPFHEEKKPDAPPVARPLTPPHMDELKKDIINQIKVHFDSLKLDDKYQNMFDELINIRKKHSTLKTDLKSKFKLLRKDFEEWKVQEPPVLLPDPNKYVYVDGKSSSNRMRRSKKTDKSVEPTDRLSERADETASITMNNQQYEQDIDVNIIKEKPKPPPTPVLTGDQKLLKLRMELPQLNVGEEVLAKWPDDGWYYRSIIKEYLGDYKYKVEDSLRDSEIVCREDLLSDINDSSLTFDVGDPVVALHPQYEFSYAPGQIIQISNDMNKILVRFYDYVESVVLREEVYKLARLKFQLDVNNITELEKRWIGQVVVARNNYSNVYELGRVTSRVGNGRQYVIEWSNNKQSIQNSNHIFGSLTRNPNIIVNDYVLAPKETIFLPGRVIGQKGNFLRVKFVDGVTDDNVNAPDCYWLSRDYYEDACRFYRRENEDLLSTLLSEEKIKKPSRESHERKTPIIDANDFHTGKSNKITTRGDQDLSD